MGKYDWGDTRDTFVRWIQEKESFNLTPPSTARLSLASSLSDTVVENAITPATGGVETSLVSIVALRKSIEMVDEELEARRTETSAIMDQEINPVLDKLDRLQQELRIKLEELGSPT